VIGSGDTIRGFINAFREDSRVKVLSSPTILATDGQPARIQVGTEEPIATGTVTSPVSTGVTSSTTIQYRNTGRILTIIPQVNAQGLVHLQVKTEVSQRGASVTVGQDSFPSFDTRDVETTAVVQDGETLAIGGIITERVNRNRLGIPFLMDIPVFGRFFGTTRDDVRRTELIMLITPHVIRSREEARTVTEEFKDVLNHVVREYGWEIQNLQRQKRRGQEAPAEKAPTAEPQSSIVPQQQEPQKSARKATIVVPADQ
jgi:general secretion pathway protein D